MAVEWLLYVYCCIHSWPSLHVGDGGAGVGVKKCDNSMIATTRADACTLALACPLEGQRIFSIQEKSLDTIFFTAFLDMGAERAGAHERHKDRKEGFQSLTPCTRHPKESYLQPTGELRGLP